MISIACILVSYMLTVKAQALCIAAAALALWFGWRRTGRVAAMSRIAAGVIVAGLAGAHVFVGAVKWHSRSIDARARRVMGQISIGMPISEADALVGRYAKKTIIDSTEVRYRFRRLATCEPYYGPPHYAVNTDKAGLITKVRTLERD